MFPHVPDAAPIHRLQDQARREARRLRRHAVDDFWRWVNAAWRRGLAGTHRQVLRSVARLKTRLLRRVNCSTEPTTRKA